MNKNKKKQINPKKKINNFYKKIHIISEFQAWVYFGCQILRRRKYVLASFKNINKYDFRKLTQFYEVIISFENVLKHWYYFIKKKDLFKIILKKKLFVYM